jgi:hypothetical protein
MTFSLSFACIENCANSIFSYKIRGWKLFKHAFYKQKGKMLNTSESRNGPATTIFNVKILLVVNH